MLYNFDKKLFFRENRDTLKLLLDCSLIFDRNIKDKYGSNVLRHASIYLHVNYNVMKLLIDNDVDNHED